MIGKIYNANFTLGSVEKPRPLLIIGQADEDDYTILPISKITRKEHLNAKYDLIIDKSVYPLLGLNEPISYIRTHKTVTLHITKFKDEISDLKSSYPDLFYTVTEKVKEYANNL